MPRILRARAAQDEKEERWVRKLASSLHGPADGIFPAKIVVRSWDGERVEAMAKNLDGSPQTVRRRLHRVDTEGIEGWGDRPKAGRPRRLTSEDDSRIMALVRQAPAGRLERRADEMVARDEQGSAQWSLDALAQAAKEVGIAVKGSQIRRICLREGVRWRRTHSWGTSTDKDFVAIWTQVVCHSTQPPQGSTTICTDETLASRCPHLPARSGRVPNRAPYQGGARLQSRAGENLGVGSAARARWQGTDSMCRLAPLEELYREAFRH